MSYRTTTLSFLSRLHNAQSGCVEWTGCTNRDGYGIVSMFKVCKSRLAHRVSWTMHFGTIPDGLCVLHRCDNPPCVNPNHLFLGTDYDNTIDKVNKGRASGRYKDVTHCLRGHEFTKDNTYIRPNGSRTCKTCDKKGKLIIKLKKKENLL